MLMYRLLGIVSVLLNISANYCGSKEEWKTRAIYQILTDRFNTDNP